MLLPGFPIYTSLQLAVLPYRWYKILRNILRILSLLWKVWHEVVTSLRGDLQSWACSNVDPGSRSLLVSYPVTLWSWLCRVASSPPPWPVEMWPPLGETHRPSICPPSPNFFSLTSSLKLSIWGSSGLCWKTATPKSSITPDFHRPRSPSSSFWISVSKGIAWHL